MNSLDHCPDVVVVQHLLQFMIHYSFTIGIKDKELIFETRIFSLKDQPIEIFQEIIFIRFNLLTFLLVFGH